MRIEAVAVILRWLALALAMLSCAIVVSLLGDPLAPIFAWVDQCLPAFAAFPGAASETISRLP